MWNILGKKALSTIVFLSFIIGASGLGLGIFSFITMQAKEGSPGTTCVVVGIWDQLYQNKDYAPYNTDQSWFISADGIQVNNSEYFFLNRTNTRFHLIISGWYRVNLLLTLSNLGGTADIYFRAFKGGSTAVAFSNRYNATTDGSFHTVEAQFYIFSDGSDYYDFYISSAPMASSVAPNPDFNQLGIEYVGDY